jgi:hypothetical protein
MPLAPRLFSAVVSSSRVPVPAKQNVVPWPSPGSGDRAMLFPSTVKTPYALGTTLPSTAPGAFR